MFQGMGKGDGLEPGIDRPNCGAVRNGKECGRPAGFATTHPGFGHCKFHGGSSPGGMLFGEKLRAKAHNLGMGGMAVDVSPLEVLLDMVRMHAGTVRWLTDRINLLREDQIFVEDPDGNVRLNEWVALHAKYSSELVKIAKTCADAGAEAKLVRMYEEQGRWVARVLDRVVSRLGLSEAQMEALPGIVQDVVAELVEDPEALVAMRPGLRPQPALPGL
jgi:hypothetical protein